MGILKQLHEADVNRLLKLSFLADFKKEAMKLPNRTPEKNVFTLSRQEWYLVFRRAMDNFFLRTRIQPCSKLIPLEEHCLPLVFWILCDTPLPEEWRPKLETYFSDPYFFCCLEHMRQDITWQNRMKQAAWDHYHQHYQFLLEVQNGFEATA